MSPLTLASGKAECSTVLHPSMHTATAIVPNIIRIFTSKFSFVFVLDRISELEIRESC